MSSSHDKYSLHFLDTNILLKTIIRWNKVTTLFSSEPTCKYLECSSTKHITERVYNEAINVLNTHRRIALKYLNNFKGQFDSNIIINANFNLNRLNDSFIQKYANQKYPEQIPYERFEGIVKAIGSYFYEKLRSYCYDPKESTLKILENEVITEINETKSDLDDICKSLIKNLNSYNDTMKRVEYSLKRIGIHEPDNLILLDCHCLGKKMLKTNLAFITLDNTILKYKKPIEGMLRNIFIFKP